MFAAAGAVSSRPGTSMQASLLSRLRCRRRCTDELARFDRTDRMAEGIALRIFATELIEFDCIRLFLSALCDDLHSQIMGKRDDGTQDHQSCAISILAYERLVDLDRVKGEPLEIGKRRIARAEIVEREASAELTDAHEHLRGIFRILHHQAFGQFELQGAGEHPGMGEYRFHIVQEIMPEQLARGNIDARKEWRFDIERALPGGEFARRALKRENAKIDNRAGFFGKRDEFGGAKPPVAGMIPAQECLETRNCAILKANDWLKENLDFAAIKRPAQISVKAKPGGPIGAHRWPENFNPVAAHAFAIPHGDFGIFQHVLARRMQLWIVERKADRGREGNFPVAEHHRR